MNEDQATRPVSEWRNRVVAEAYATQPIVAEAYQRMEALRHEAKVESDLVAKENEVLRIELELANNCIYFLIAVIVPVLIWAAIATAILMKR